MANSCRSTPQEDEMSVISIFSVVEFRPSAKTTDEIRESSQLFLTSERANNILHALRTSQYIPSTIRKYLLSFLSFIKKFETGEDLSTINNLIVIFSKSTTSLRYIIKEDRKSCMKFCLKWWNAVLKVSEEECDIFFRRNGALTAKFKEFLLTNGCNAPMTKSKGIYLIRGPVLRQEFDKLLHDFKNQSTWCGCMPEDSDIDYVMENPVDEQFRSGDAFSPLYSSIATETMFPQSL